MILLRKFMDKAHLEILSKSLALIVNRPAGLVLAIDFYWLDLFALRKGPELLLAGSFLE